LEAPVFNQVLAATNRRCPCAGVGRFGLHVRLHRLVIVGCDF
jgi:hypothetical protein